MKERVARLRVASEEEVSSEASGEVADKAKSRGREDSETGHDMAGSKDEQKLSDLGPEGTEKISRKWLGALAIGSVLLAFLAFLFINSQNKSTSATVVSEKNAGESGAQATLVPAETMTTVPTPTVKLVENEPTESSLTSPTLLTSPILDNSQKQFSIGATVVVTGTGKDRLALRSDPGPHYSRIKLIKDGSTLTIIDGPVDADGFTWWKVRTQEGTDGWAVSDYLAIASSYPTPTLVPTYTPTPSATPTQRVVSHSPPTATPVPAVIPKTNMNVRAGPGTNYPIIGSAKQGQSYRVTGRNANSDWWQIDFGGKRGWLAASLTEGQFSVSVISVVTPPPMPTSLSPKSSNSLPKGILLYDCSTGKGICEYNFATQESRLVISGDVSWPDFSGDGKYITYVESAWNGPARTDCIIIIASNYSDSRRVICSDPSSKDEWFKFPSLSFDGSRLVFELISKYQYIHLINSDGSGLGRIHGGREPDWSPVSNTITFRESYGSEGGIFSLDLDNPPYWYPYRITSGDDGLPAWSPNGKQIAFVRKENNNIDIYTINSDGSNLKRLTERPATDRGPSWSPDGQWIAFTSDEGGTWGIWIMRSDGTQKQRIVDFGWSSEGYGISFKLSWRK